MVARKTPSTAGRTGPRNSENVVSSRKASTRAPAPAAGRRHRWIGPGQPRRQRAHAHHRRTHPVRRSGRGGGPVGTSAQACAPRTGGRPGFSRSGPPRSGDRDGTRSHAPHRDSAGREASGYAWPGQRTRPRRKPSAYRRHPLLERGAPVSHPRGAPGPAAGLRSAHRRRQPVRPRRGFVRSEQPRGPRGRRAELLAAARGRGRQAPWRRSPAQRLTFTATPNGSYPSRVRAVRPLSKSRQSPVADIYRRLIC